MPFPLCSFVSNVKACTLAHHHHTVDAAVAVFAVDRDLDGLIHTLLTLASAEALIWSVECAQCDFNSP